MITYRHEPVARELIEACEYVVERYTELRDTRPRVELALEPWFQMKDVDSGLTKAASDYLAHYEGEEPLVLTLKSNFEKYGISKGLAKGTINTIASRVFRRKPMDVDR